MPDLFEPRIKSVQVPCKQCGKQLEFAESALSIFESADAVLCMECLLKSDTTSINEGKVSLSTRTTIIDQIVEDFSTHLRNVLMRCVKPDLTWNREYGFADWSGNDQIAAAYAPSIWYTMRQSQEREQTKDS